MKISTHHAMLGSTLLHVALGFSTEFGGHLTLSRRQASEAFDWESITPTQNLQYHDCYGIFQCARLKVPLDWNHANQSSCSGSSKWAALAITTLPASVAKSDPSYGGPVLINPGGPGGSGTEMAIWSGQYLQAILDGERHYDIVGFDPRGNGYSTPPADCFGNEFNRAADTIRREGLPPIAASVEALNINYQVSKGHADLCAGVGPDSIFAHMSTASVARDMLEFVDRDDELRRMETKAPASDELPRLQYIGVSYGTILGNTFASMFPGRVKRMVLDGVADADDYMSGSWAKNLQDAEAAVDHYYQTCFDAADACPLRQKGDSSFSEIRQRIDAYVAALEESPISTLHEGRPRLVTSLLIRDTIRRTLYSPIVLFEPMAIALAESMAGNHSLLLENSQAAAVPEFAESCVETEPGAPPPPHPWTNDGGMGVLCGDSNDSSGARDSEWAWNLTRFLHEQSPTFGEAWSRIPLSCSGWTVSPKYTFTGPFGSPAPLETGPTAETPSAPMLILSTHLDHATPLENAYALSERHGGSAVVIQESIGHCALISSKSECTASLLREYFDTGKVPKSGTVCKEDCSASIPFKPCPGFIE